MCVSMATEPLADPDLQIRGGPVIQTLRYGGRAVSRGGGRGGGQLPRAPPLDPPLETNDNYSLSRSRNLTSVSSAEILVLGP